MTEDERDFNNWEGQMDRLDESDFRLQERDDLTLEVCLDLAQRFLNAVKNDEVCVYEDPQTGQTMIILPSEQLADSNE